MLTTRAFPVGLHAKGMTALKNFRDLIPGELIMVRVFSFLVAVVATVQSANAALLASWNFESNANGIVANDIVGTASAMSNVGPNTPLAGRTYGNNGAYYALNKSWRVSQFNNVNESSVLAGRYSTLSFTNTGSNPIQLTDLSLKIRNASGTQSRGVQIMVQKNDGPVVALGTYLRTSTVYSTSTGSLENFDLFKDDTLSVYFRFFKSASDNNTTNRVLELDDIVINGDVVPEPASLAVFGLVGAGLAVARRRRK